MGTKANFGTVFILLVAQLTTAQTAELRSNIPGYFLLNGVKTIIQNPIPYIETGCPRVSKNFFDMMVHSQDSVVLSPFRAKVMEVFELEGEWAVMLDLEGEYFFFIASMKRTILKKGDIVEKEGKIGEGTWDNDDKHFSIDLAVYRKDRFKTNNKKVEKYLLEL